MADEKSSGNDVPFEINVIGEETGEKFPGNFTAKVRLSFRDQLRRDQLRRELIGPQGGISTDDAIGKAVMLSELSVRLTKTPKWWTEAADGLDLSDKNVLEAVYEAAMKVEREAAEAKKKRAADAAEKMRADQDERDKADA